MPKGKGWTANKLIATEVATTQGEAEQRARSLMIRFVLLDCSVRVFERNVRAGGTDTTVWVVVVREKEKR